MSIINKKYKILEKIGNGKFGIVYKGINYKTNEYIAIKTEKKENNIRLLKNETTILKYLYDQGSRCTPIIYWYGVDSEYTYLIMSFYKISLFDYSINNSIAIDKINNLMVIFIDIIETIHEKYILHRDIKPQNFMFHNDQLFLIDFGFATFYINENKKHQTNLISNNIIGSPKYISINIHNGNTPSRRDELISLGYIYLYLLCNELSWDSLKKEENIENYEEYHIYHFKNKQRKILKEWINIEPICLKINNQIHEYLDYCYRLNYEDTPNYNALKQLFILHP